ncbi:hypothetical protein [Microvirga calopogonii]|uniref:hypothetical protein n=1 Tax=Microvirga calopogonii TaxID=2078013 RepID=UPI000E0D1A46|nr:hypothetical protein [Microvirga calopogonii]
MLHHLRASAPAFGLIAGVSASSGLAAEMIEAIGAERCGGLRKPYAIEFLAPEDADVQASTKRMVNGREDIDSAPPALLLDGKLCTDGRCAFRAAKVSLWVTSTWAHSPWDCESATS